jgi:hypothetical protein
MLVKAPEHKLLDEMPEPLGAAMWTPSRGSVALCTGHWRIVDYLADDQTTNTDTSNKEPFTTAYVYVDEFFAASGSGMFPAFLADQGVLTKVMLELTRSSCLRSWTCACTVIFVLSLSTRRCQTVCTE